jgi:uncharacterized protein GlcG (DUF336 family)
MVLTLGRYSTGPLLRSVAPCLALCIGLASCGGGAGSDPANSGNGAAQFPEPPAGSAFLNANDADLLVRTAAATANSDSMAIAVVDRLGRILAVWKGLNTPAMSASNLGVMVPTEELAVSLARTAAFFSNDQAPLSSRTVRFISGIHFPPGIANTPNADLYGIENTNRGCVLSTSFLPGQEIPLPRLIGGTPSHLGIITGKRDIMDRAGNDVQAIGDVNPGGVPIFKDDPVLGTSHLAGGIGISGAPLDVAEFVAFSGAALAGVPAAQTDGIGFHFPLPTPGVVVVGGIELPFVNNTSAPSDLQPPSGTFNSAQYVVTPVDSAGPPPDLWLVGPNDGPVGGLKAADVMKIADNAVATANQTRAVIRLPIGSRARMMIAVADLDGTIIGLFRMHDATIFSIDVATSKARNVIYFSGSNRSATDLPGVPMGTAVTNRTISFGAQPFYPPGIDGSSPGPFFNLFLEDTANACTEGAHVSSSNQGAHSNQSGIVFFPGSVPLYVNGQLVGGLGVSGDGVDQDDFVTAGGMVGFEAPANTRADQVLDQGVRLPYLKFPRNPTN